MAGYALAKLKRAVQECIRLSFYLLKFAHLRFDL
jgi:hypothetical protein